MLAIERVGSGVRFAVRVIPRSGRAGVAGIRGDALLVRLHAPPIEGAANAELVAVLSAALRVPKSAVAIVSGDRSRQKRVHVEGIDEQIVRAVVGSG
ncbi:MAG TPA: DUF167 domain-containing protein [Vicinamibacterales bacterium]